MSDEIKGVAVLDDTAWPERLYFVAVPASRPAFVHYIPVGPIKDERCWAYTRRGAELDVQPSVLIRRPMRRDERTVEWVEAFHSPGSWTVTMRLWSELRGTVKADDPYNACREINVAMLPADDA